MKIYRYYIPTIIMLIISFASACTQDEYEPDPVGEKVPYEESPKKGLSEELLSSNHTIFKAALEKSNVSDSLENWEHSRLTLLVPSDDAFKGAGIDINTIQSMTTEALDTLLLYYIVDGTFDTSGVGYTFGNIRMSTKLYDSHLIIRGKYDIAPYNYTHYIAINNDKVLINGKIMGDYTVQHTDLGDVIYIDYFLKRPTKDMWTTMEEDGRFSIFLEVLEMNDYMYLPKKLNEWQYDETGEFLYSNLPSGINETRQLMKLKLSDKSKLVRNFSSWNANIQLLSIFAPIDEAFHKAGYNTAEEFREMNDYMYYREYYYWYDEWEWGYLTIPSMLKNDSILSYHSWGDMYSKATYGYGAMNSTIFFSNELTDTHLSNYVIIPGANGSASDFKNPFTFSQGSDGSIRVKLKNAKDGTETATIVEPDILTVNGPIHAVDRLFIPKDF